MSRRLLSISVLVGSALSLAGAGCIVTQRLVIGSPEGGFFYGYLKSFDNRSIEPFLIACPLVAAAVAESWRWLMRLSNEDRGGVTPLHEWTLILAWCLLAVGIQGLLRLMTPFPLGAMFASDVSNSFYSVALRFDVESILGDFERLRPSWALHAQSNLPGKLLLVRALIDVSRRADVLAWMIVVLSNLGGVLLYLFVRDLFKDRFVAGLSVILYLFTPAKLYFFPLLNTVTPVVVLACACLVLRWLHTGRTIYAASLGIAVYGLALFEPTALVVGVLFATLLVHTIVSGRMTLRAAFLQIVVGILTFAVTYFAMVLWFGFDLIGAFRDVAADATAFNVEARRPYGIWVRQNVVDFLFGVGFCQIVLFAAALADGVTGLKTQRPSPQTVSIVLICSAILAMVGLADVIGVNRGEVIRLWIFLACFWQIPAAYACRRLESSLAFTVVLITTALQIALGTAMLAFIVP
jgi:methylthioxylose transferase